MAGPDLPGGSAGKESACNVGDLGSIPGLGTPPWRRERIPTPIFWPGEFHGLYNQARLRLLLAAGPPLASSVGHNPGGTTIPSKHPDAPDLGFLCGGGSHGLGRY